MIRYLIELKYTSVVMSKSHFLSSFSIFISTKSFNTFSPFNAISRYQHIPSPNSTTKISLTTDNPETEAHNTNITHPQFKACSNRSPDPSAFGERRSGTGGDASRRPSGHLWRASREGSNPRPIARRY